MADIVKILLENDYWKEASYCMGWERCRSAGRIRGRPCVFAAQHKEEVLSHMCYRKVRLAPFTREMLADFIMKRVK